MADVMTAQKVAARTEDAVKVYGKGQTEVRALDGVTVEFASGRYTAVMGPSGSGKSTLLHCVAGLDSLTSGRAFIGDVDLSTLNDQKLTILRRDRVGFVFQAYNLVPTISAAKNITLPLLLAGRKGDPAWISQVIEITGIGDRLEHRPRTAGQIFNVSPVQGSIGALGADGIAVYSDDATKHHLTLGSPVSVVFRDTGPKTLRVALIYGDNQAAPSANPGSKTSYFLGTPGYDANFAAPHFDTQVFVKKAPGVSTAAALAAVKTVAAQYAPGTTVQDQAAYKAEQTKPIDQILALIYTLLALAIVIALLGIGNTLALSIFERTRELGVMRAVGMTRRQLRGTIRWESVIIALQGTLLGLVVGVFFGWALVAAQKNQGLSVFSVPYLTLIIIILLAALAGVVAAILPSRRAAKLNVLRAIVTE